jgi:putative hydrolase of the HAD superfamily
MGALRVIGFDLDNTLYDQGQHMLSFFRAAALELAPRICRAASDIDRVFVGVWRVRTSYYPHLFDEALDALGIVDRGLVPELVAMFHEHDAELTLFDGVRDMLGRLRERFSLFVITDGNARMQERKISRLALAPLFDEIVTTGTHGKAWTKPSPQPYQHVLARFGGSPVEFLYVGDNPACDFAGARQIGMRTARVLTEPFANRPHDGVDFVLTRTTDLEQVLRDSQAAV